MALPRPAVVGALAAAAIALAGCTSSADDPKKPAAGRPPAVGTPTSTAPTVSPAPSATTPATPPTTAVTPLADRLLADINNPGTEARWRWEVGTTGPASSRPLGACARATLADIGATDVVQRTFFPADDSENSAAEQVAEFADTTSVAQAWSVLASWRTQCANRKVAGTTPKVFEMRSSRTARGAETRWYPVVWGSATDLHPLEYLGMVRHGTRIAVLRITVMSRAMDFMPGPDGKYLIENPLARAAARLG